MGLWVVLNTVSDFRESFLSAKVKEIVRKIEIDGWEKSLNGLKDAAEYCFKY